MYRVKAQSWLKHMDFILLDVLCLQISVALAYFVRHGFQNPHVASYYGILVVYILIDVCIIICNSTMKNVLKRGRYVEFSTTVKHVFWVEAVMGLYLFSVRASDYYSRIVIYLTGGFYLVISFLIRQGWKQRILKRKTARDASTMYIITISDWAERYARDLVSRNRGEYIFSGICILDKDMQGSKIGGIPVSSSRDTVFQYLCREWVDEVFIGLPRDWEDTDSLVNQLTEMGIVAHVDLIGSNRYLGPMQMVERLEGHTVLTVSMNFASVKQAIFKRAVDVVAGLAGCLITAVLTLILGPLIYIKSPGPIFFTQTRIGRNGRRFKMYKFRSMYMDAEARKAELMKENRVKDGMMFKLEYDPRIIGCKKLPDGTIKKGIGNFIRDCSLDEFPQFFNVLTGTMSLCGTRPPTEDEWNKYQLHHRARLAIKPGITGLWQVSGRSNITDFEDVVELDKKYIREWSMGLDFKIVLKTVAAVLKRDGAL